METRKATVRIRGTQRLISEEEAKAGKGGAKRAGCSRAEEGREPGGEADCTQQTVLGKYFARNGRRFVVWEEQDENGQAIRAMIKIFEGGFEVVKKGAVGTRLTFRPGMRCEAGYDTACGRLPAALNVETVEICAAEGEPGGGSETGGEEAAKHGQEAVRGRVFLRARASYVLELSGRPVSKNTVEVEVGPIEPN